jgi:dTDP-4-dehydrorhamnose 3,5-epimerase
MAGLPKSEATRIAGVRVLTPARHGDDRGFFSETFNRRALGEVGIDVEFVQDNHAFSAVQGTLRGLHFQIPPHTQGKLVRVTKGAILGVVVDLRRKSETYGAYASVVVSRSLWNQVYIPPGIAHGYLTLEPDTEVIYKVDRYYSPEHERGLRWNDPALGIVWPATGADYVVAPRDMNWPDFAALPTYF